MEREAFRQAVFARDNHKCVICGIDAVDAHHILERRLFKCGGYQVDNGASLCRACHYCAEMTTISVETIRDACGIRTPYIPEHLYIDQDYDKWGNVILDNGYRAKGELFEDESVQKILGEGNCLHLFTDYVKYPRTYHLPWSLSISEDDRVIDTSCFDGKTIIMTEKMDGENTTLYRDYYHARSVDSKNHPTRNWAKAFHSRLAHDIPEGWRVCCENVYAKHSIHYKNLKSYVYGISIWNEHNICLDWDETLEWFNLLGIVPVPFIAKIIWNEEEIKRNCIAAAPFVDIEGFVVRNEGQFAYKDFNKNVAKFVRPNHVTTTKHWMYGQKIEENELDVCVL